MKKKPAEENGLKAERVQVWQRVLNATRSTASRVCDFLDAVIEAARALRKVFGSLIRKS